VRVVAEALDEKVDERADLGRKELAAWIDREDR